MTSAREVAERYVEHVNAHDVDSLMTLFADDAVLEAPRGIGTLDGLDAIRSFYTDLVFSASPRVRAAHFVEAGDECVVELEAALSTEIGDTAAGEVSNLVDVFSINDAGLIRRLAIYMR